MLEFDPLSVDDESVSFTLRIVRNLNGNLRFAGRAVSYGFPHGYETRMAVITEHAFNRLPYRG